MFLFEDGVSVEDFFCYHFYEKKYSERKQFVSLWKSIRINKLLNKKCKRELVEDKSIFGSYFKKYLKRNQISCENLDYQTYLQFLKKEKSIIAKPTFGCNGNGIFIIEENASEEQLKNAYNIITKEPYVLETVLVQDGLLKQLNPHTLNTIRINVLNNHGNMRVVNAILRSGQGEVVTDNICAGGCVTEIDINTGEFISEFVDLSNHSYKCHPISGIRLVGQKCPNWEKAKNLALKVTEELTGVVYASWDIAIIKNNEVAVVEGNTWGNFNIQQVPRQKGVWPEYKKFISEWQNIEKNI